MYQKSKFIEKLFFLLKSPIFILPTICFLAYGILIPWLGLYADDQTFIWTFETLKEVGIYRYFTIGGNRPVWGIFYSFFVPLLGHQPEIWHIFGIFWLLICGLLIYKLINLLFPDQRTLPLILASLFIVYPGFQLQFISLTVGHMWLIYAFFLSSIILTILSITKKENYLLFSSLAILSSTVNLLAFEYFFTLEFLRPILIGYVLRNYSPNLSSKVQKSLKIWCPYLLLLLAIIIWRIFFFEFQTIRYQFSIIDQLKLNPINTVKELIPIIIKNVFWSTTFQAWGQSFTKLFNLDISSKINLLTIIFTIVLIGTILIWFWIIKFEINLKRYSIGFLISAGIFGLLLAGLPFWVTRLEVNPSYWNSRFTMPFMLGMVLLLAGLMSSIPNTIFQRILTALLLSTAIINQFLVANDFRRDWDIHNEILWQLSWRLGELEKGTTILSNDLPIKYFSDNTFSAELNWIAANGKQKNQPEYLFGYLSEFMRFGLPYQEPGINFSKDMISSTFYGSTDKVVVIHYRYGSCLRVLDPRLDPFNPLINMESQQAAIISNVDLINPKGPLFYLKDSVYGRSPTNDECYLFQKSQLMGQMGMWNEVVNISHEINFQSNKIRRDPMLSIVFIEGFLNTGDLEKALEISRGMYKLNSDFSPILCKYWLDLNKDKILTNISTFRKEFNCN